MSDEINNSENNPNNEPPTEVEKKRRKRLPKGTVPPVLSLRESAKIAQAFYEEAGGEANYDLFSKITNNSPSSSVFSKKIALLKNTGVIEEPSDRQLKLTETGISIVAPKEPKERQSALKSVFLAVDVYKSIYDKYAGKLLPQDDFLKNNIVEYVPRELADTWMELFKDSAEYAGLFFQREDGKIQVLEGVGKNSDEDVEIESDTGGENGNNNGDVKEPEMPDQKPPAQPPPPTQTAKTDFQFLIEILNPADMTDEEQQAVWTLIQFLKKKETGVIK